MNIYRLPFTAAIPAAPAADLIVIQPGARGCELLGWRIGFLGVPLEETVAIEVVHLAPTVTVIGGVPIIGHPNRPGTETAELTATAVPTKAGTRGTATIVETLPWNMGEPWGRNVPENLRTQAVTGEAIVVRLATPLAIARDLVATVFVLEGG